MRFKQASIVVLFNSSVHRIGDYVDTSYVIDDHSVQYTWENFPFLEAPMLSTSLSNIIVLLVHGVFLLEFTCHTCCRLAMA